MLNNLFDSIDPLLTELFEGFEYPWQVLPVLEDFLKSKIRAAVNGTISDSAEIEPECMYMGAGTRVLGHARIEGIVYIGENCLIGHGALLRGAVYLGDDCVVGQGVELKNHVAMNRSKLSHLNSLPDAIVGNDVGVAGGAMFANVTLYNSEVKASLADTRVRTGLKMFSTVIGDRVQVGANAVLGPGAVLEQDSVVYPCVRFNGFAPKGAAVKDNSY